MSGHEAFNKLLNQAISISKGETQHVRVNDEGRAVVGNVSGGEEKWVNGMVYPMNQSTYTELLGINKA